MMVDAWKECGLKIHGENHSERTTSSTGHVLEMSCVVAIEEKV